ncbi:hypothetical protein VB735_07760 [Halotia wernerae UHCC 0503]|nr:hypothetical protein [Halotia wernerae UHCC 0503]
MGQSSTLIRSTPDHTHDPDAHNKASEFLSNKPAVEKVKSQPGDAVENAVVANVEYQIAQLQRSQLLIERLEVVTIWIQGR